MLCDIWCHLYNLKNVKNTYGGVLLLVNLQAVAGHFFPFLICANGSKSRKASHKFIIGTANFSSDFHFCK